MTVFCYQDVVDPVSVFLPQSLHVVSPEMVGIIFLTFVRLEAKITADQVNILHAHIHGQLDQRKKTAASL